MNGTEWLRHISQQIKTLDYELHAALRIFVNDELEPEQMTAFFDASLKRDRMMAQVLSFLAEQHHHQATGRYRRAMDRNRAVTTALAKRRGFAEFHLNGNSANPDGRHEFLVEIQGGDPSIGISQNGRPKA